MTSESEARATYDGFVRSGMVRFHEGLEPLLRPIDEVEPAPYNYNNGDVEEVCTSIEVNGMYRPVYVQKSTGHIIAGNHTWLACKTLEAQVVPVVELDLDDTQAKRIMVADNQIARLAQPDNGLLVALLNEIEERADNGLVGTGLTEEDADVLRKLNEIPLDTGSDDFAQWPTFQCRVPPHVLRAFHYMTREAGDDRAKFELILRLAGWDGHKVDE